MPIPLTLDIVKSPFSGETFQEYIDWKMLIKMIISPDILRTTTHKNKFGEKLQFENERKQVIEILKKGCKHTLFRKKIDTDINKMLPLLYHHTDKYMSSNLQVKYFYDKKKEIGRVYPEKSLSLCNLRRQIRHSLAYENYIDIDIVNCHFVLADQIFNNEEIQLPIIHDYVLNRNRYLKELGTHFKVEGYYDGLDYTKPEDYDVLKEYFVRKLYYGTDDGWKNDNNLPPIAMPEFSSKLDADFDKMAELIKQNNPEMLKMVNEKTFNVNGTIVSWFLQEYERRILEKLFEFLHKTKHIKHRNCVLCFDGIMIRTNEKNKDETLLKKLLKDAEIYIKKELDFSIEFKAKPFDKLEYIDVLNEIDVPYVDDPTILIDDKDDDESSNIIYEQFVKEDLIYCKGQFYLKVENLWITNEQVINSNLINIVLSSGIKTTTAKGEIKCYAQHASNAKNIVSIVKGKASMNPRDDMYNKFHDTTTGKLCFKDGVLFIETQEWRNWNDPYFEQDENKIYPTIIIDREFEKVFLATKNNDNTEYDLNQQINEIETKLFKPILDTQTDKMLHFLSRAIAGFYQDKDWGVWIGSRNCGKGCINTLLTTAFCGYITSLPSQVLMCQRMRSNDTKELSWMFDLQYPRLAVIQEADRKDENMKINGTTIKSVCSGGDPQKTRRNYGEIIEIILSSKILFMNNDFPRVEPADALETCIQFNSGKQFKTKSFIEERKSSLNEQLKSIDDEDIKYSLLKELDTYLLADDKIKDDCKSLKWGNAFVLLLMRKFVNKKLEPSNDSDLKEDSNDTNDLINESLIFTKNDEDRLSNNRLKEINGVLSTGLSFQKFKNLLIARGCVEYRTGGERGLKFIKEITKPEK